MLVFLTVPRVGLQCVVVVIPHQTHSLVDLKKKQMHAIDLSKRQII